jgi:hypothetical protein
LILHRPQNPLRGVPLFSYSSPCTFKLY